MTGIHHLRRVLEHVGQGKPLAGDDAAWLIRAAGNYMADPITKRLDVELDLQPRWGEPGWWTLEARSDRDALIASIDRQLFAKLDVATAARLIVAVANDGRRHGSAVLPQVEATFVESIGKTGRSVPGLRQVSNILKRARSTP